MSAWTKAGQLGKLLRGNIGTMAFACDRCDRGPLYPYRYVDERPDAPVRVRGANATYVRKVNGDLVVVCETCLKGEA